MNRSTKLVHTWIFKSLKECANHSTILTSLRLPQNIEVTNKNLFNSNLHLSKTVNLLLYFQLITAAPMAFWNGYRLYVCCFMYAFQWLGY